MKESTDVHGPEGILKVLTLSLDAVPQVVSAPAQQETDLQAEGKEDEECVSVGSI